VGKTLQVARKEREREEKESSTYFEKIETLSHFFANNEAVIFYTGFTTGV